MNGIIASHDFSLLRRLVKPPTTVQSEVTLPWYENHSRKARNLQIQDPMEKLRTEVEKLHERV
jgi:hypothetical protein